MCQWLVMRLVTIRRSVRLMIVDLYPTRKVATISDRTSELWHNCINSKTDVGVDLFAGDISLISADNLIIVPIVGRGMRISLPFAPMVEIGVWRMESATCVSGVFMVFYSFVTSLLT